MSKRPMTRLFKWMGFGALIGLLLLVLVAGWAWWRLHASLAQLNGEHALPGLTAPVRVDRDTLGVPTIQATNRLDASRALGFIHAQDRFLQMDLLRRSAAGELAGLFGSALLDRDRGARLHQFRKRAQVFVRQQASPEERAIIQAYTDGVNAGLKALGAAPPEYLLLRVHPEPWRTEDSILVGFAMFFALQDSQGNDDLLYAGLSRWFPPQVRDFYLSQGSFYQAAVDDSQLPLPPLPSSEVFTFRSATNQVSERESTETPDPDSLVPGSNSWAVDGRVSATGGAIVANDMHLMLQLPHYWYRARLIYHDDRLGRQDVIGVTLPGTPAVIVGSNRYLAWAFTNAFLDTTDLVRLELDPSNPQCYRTPGGWRDFELATEILQVKGGSSQNQIITNTIWGPVVGKRGLTEPHALSWIAHQPGAVSMGLLRLERARDVATALELAPEIGVPLQNLVVGDQTGSIGYTLIGRLPMRQGFNGQQPVSWADGTCHWDGFLPAAHYPRVINPASGRLWTANHRILGSPAYLALHPVSQDFGARARQICDDLAPMSRVTERDMLTIHRDDRGLYLERWQKLMLTALERSATTNKVWKEMQTYVADWGGRAVPSSSGYRFVVEFRNRVIGLVMKPVRQRLRDGGIEPGIWPSWTLETPVWQIISQRADHLVDPRFASIDDLLQTAISELLESLAQQKLPLDRATWGQKNAFTMSHPISQAVPFLSRWLDIPPAQLPGDDHMPRVQGRSFGASERLVVSPGREEQGLFHMPGGQSGHFLSPFYRAGHEAWMTVEPSPLLPGPSRFQLCLQ